MSNSLFIKNTGFTAEELKMIDSIANEFFIRKQLMYLHMKPYEQIKAVQDSYRRAFTFVNTRKEIYEKGLPTE